MRIVLDTNVIVSAAILPQSVTRRCFDTVLRHHQPLTSVATQEEMQEVLFRCKLDKYAPLQGRLEVLRLFLEIASPITPLIRITACRDPDDNCFLELAVDGQAEVIVTGDLDLLTLSPFRGIQIIRPDQFLAL